MSEYDLRAVHELLTSAFSAGELRRFCRDHDPFQPILHRFPVNASLNEMADAVIEYCEQHVLLEELLADVAEANPRQFSRFQDRIPRGQNAEALTQESEIGRSQPAQQQHAQMPKTANQSPESDLSLRQRRSHRNQLREFLSQPIWGGIDAITGMIALLVAILALLITIVIWRWPDFESLFGFGSGCQLEITALSATKSILQPDESTNVTVIVNNCGEGLTYVWTTEKGRIEPAGPTALSTVTYAAPGFVGLDKVHVVARDAAGRTDSSEIPITVVQNEAVP